MLKSVCFSSKHLNISKVQFSIHNAPHINVDNSRLGNPRCKQSKGQRWPSLPEELWHAIVMLIQFPRNLTRIKHWHIAIKWKSIAEIRRNKAILLNRRPVRANCWRDIVTNQIHQLKILHLTENFQSNYHKQYISVMKSSQVTANHWLLDINPL